MAEITDTAATTTGPLDTQDGARPLSGQVALVAGATRGAGRGIARELAAAGAMVWCTGRSTRLDPQREAGVGFDLKRRPETIEETAELIIEAGGSARAVRVDHTRAGEVTALVEQIRAESGRLDILINDIWGGDAEIEWGSAPWEADAERGIATIERVLRTHALTSRAALPLLREGGAGLVVEVTDGDFPGYRGQYYYDLAKNLPVRMCRALASELLSAGDDQLTAVAITPGFLRSEAMLEHFGVTASTWESAISADRHFVASETPHFVGRAIVAVAAATDRRRFNGQLLSSWGVARWAGFTDIDGRRPDWGAHFDADIARILAAHETGAAAPDDVRQLVQARYLQLVGDRHRLSDCATMAAWLGLGPRALHDRW